MLDDLDAVPWQALRHAFGEASDVPRLLRALGSADRDERQAALKALFGCLVHQGSVGEVTLRAVPFLFELLADPSTPERNWLAFLLASIGDGKGYLRAHTSLDEQSWRKILAERGTTLEAELEREDELVRKIRLEIGRGVHLLAPHLRDSQSEIRAAVARAVGHHAARAAELLPLLKAAEARETAADARDALRLSLARLRNAPSE
jgi:HEAT repeat protein